MAEKSKDTLDQSILSASRVVEARMQAQSKKRIAAKQRAARSRATAREQRGGGRVWVPEHTIARGGRRYRVAGYWRKR